MKSNYQKLIAVGFLFLVCTQSKAQETSTFTITPELSKKVIESLPYESIAVFPVSYKEIEYREKDTSTIMSKRSTFMISGLSINISKLSGKFSKLPDLYRVAIENIKNKFVKDEVFSNYDAYDMSIMTKTYPLIQKVGTNEYYYIMSDEFVNTLIKSEQNKEILTLVHKLGYKEYKDFYGDLFIKTKTCEVKLDSFTYKLIKENPNWISELDKDQTQIANLVKQTIPHSKTLDKYLNTYNIKRSRMPVSELNSWRTATKNAQQLHNQIYKLTEKYHGNMNSFTLLDKSNTLEIFVDNLLASKGVLGM